MLSGLCEELAKRYATVGVVGRTKAKMQSLAHVENIIPIYVDYTDLEVLERELKKFAESFGKPDTVVTWVHSTAPNAVLVAAKYCNGRLYEVTGHSGSEQNHVSRQHEESIVALRLDYHRIILGRVGNRWLTNDEISAGAIQALESPGSEYVVGQL